MHLLRLHHNFNRPQNAKCILRRGGSGTSALLISGSRKSGRPEIRIPRRHNTDRITGPLIRGHFVYVMEGAAMIGVG